MGSGRLTTEELTPRVQRRIPVKHHSHSPVSFVRQFSFYFPLEDLIPRQEVYSPVVPAWPDCVVNTKEDDHMFTRVNFHNLHCPQGKHILLMEEDTRLFGMLNPLHDIHECDGPLIGDLRNIH